MSSHTNPTIPFYPPQLIISPDGRFYWDYEKRRWVRLPSDGNSFWYFLLGVLLAAGIAYIAFVL